MVAALFGKIAVSCAATDNPALAGRRYSCMASAKASSALAYGRAVLALVTVVRRPRRRFTGGIGQLAWVASVNVTGAGASFGGRCSCSG